MFVFNVTTLKSKHYKSIPMLSKKVFLDFKAKISNTCCLPMSIIIEVFKFIENKY